MRINVLLVWATFCLAFVSFSTESVAQTIIEPLNIERLDGWNNLKRMNVDLTLNDSILFVKSYSDKPNTLSFRLNLIAAIEKKAYYYIGLDAVNFVSNHSPIFFVVFKHQGKEVGKSYFSAKSSGYVFLTPAEFDEILIKIKLYEGIFKMSKFSINKILLDTSINSRTDKNKNTCFDLLLDSIDVDAKNIIETADKYIEGKQLGNDRFMYKTLDETIWSNIHGRVYNRWLHGHIWLLTLEKAYKRTDNEQYIEFGKKCIKSYFDFLDKGGFDSSIVWHDETTARRLHSWIIFAPHIYSDRNLYNRLQHEIHLIASKLSADNFFTKFNNHGMFQSSALLSYSHYADKEPLRLIFREIALSRLDEYFSESITTEGISYENTPLYHYIIMSNLKGVVNFMNEVGLADDRRYKKFKNLYELGEQYAIHLVRPDGTVPNLGDCVKFSINGIYKNLYESKEFMYVSSQFKKGSPPLKRAVVFPETGYFIYRDSWTSNTSFYFIFSSAYKHWSHKHNDDLSFILSLEGRDIFIDCGYFGYEYTDPNVRFGYSTFAHNTLSIDDSSLGVIDNQDKKYGQTYIERCSFDNESFSVAAINNRWDQAVHKRNVYYSAVNSEIFVCDSVISKDSLNHKYQIIYHLDENVIPTMKRDKVYLYDKINGRKIGSLFFSSESFMQIKLFYGDNDPNIKGIHKISDAQKGFNSHYVIVVEFFTDILSLKTKIKLVN